MDIPMSFALYSYTVLMRTPRINSLTTEMLAWDNGKRSTTDVLKEWFENKDRDLKGRGV